MTMTSNSNPNEQPTAKTLTSEQIDLLNGLATDRVQKRDTWKEKAQRNNNAGIAFVIADRCEKEAVAIVVAIAVVEEVQQLRQRIADLEAQQALVMGIIDEVQGDSDSNGWTFACEAIRNKINEAKAGAK